MCVSLSRIIHSFFIHDTPSFDTHHVGSVLTPCRIPSASHSPYSITSDPPIRVGRLRCLDTTACFASWSAYGLQVRRPTLRSSGLGLATWICFAKPFGPPSESTSLRSTDPSDLWRSFSRIGSLRGTSPLRYPSSITHRLSVLFSSLVTPFITRLVPRLVIHSVTCGVHSSCPLLPSFRSSMMSVVSIPRSQAPLFCSVLHSRGLRPCLLRRSYFHFQESLELRCFVGDLI